MKTKIILTAALLCVSSLNSFAKPLKVFILAGQSNMAGQGSIEPSITRKTLAYTGTTENGTKRGDYLGSTKPNIGTTTATSRYWTVIYNDAAANAHPIYALSDPLTISSR